METPGRIRVVVRLRPASGPVAVRVDAEQRSLTVPASRGDVLEPAARQEGGVPHANCGAHKGGRGGGDGGSAGGGLRFTVDEIYDAAASQRTVYDAECGPLVESAMCDGCNATLLAYGQTGAGKTHTVLGRRGGGGGGGVITGAAASALFEERGLVPRTFDQVFALARQRCRHGASVDVRLSVLEIYNDTLIDLLAESNHTTADGLFGGGAATNHKKAQKHRRQKAVFGQHQGGEGGGGAAASSSSSSEALHIVERPSGAVEVRGLTVAAAHSAEEAIQFLGEAEINRAVASHAMNVASSRSHLVVTVHITVRETQQRARRPSARDGDAETAEMGAGAASSDDDDEEEERVVRSKVHLVDLAGSERTKVTASREATATVREAGFINKSLTFLEQVVIALAEPGRGHLPYRSSKLTHFLRDSLGGACRTTLVACVWPDAAQADQTQGTLRFATRLACIPCTPVRAADRREAEDRRRGRGSAQAVRLLQEDVHALRAELALHDLVARRPQPDYAYGRLPPAHLARARRQAGEYIMQQPSSSSLSSSSSRRADDYEGGGDGDLAKEKNNEPAVVTVAQVRAVYAALGAVARAALRHAPPDVARRLVRDLTGFDAADSNRPAANDTNANDDEEDEEENHHNSASSPPPPSSSGAKKTLKKKKPARRRRSSPHGEEGGGDNNQGRRREAPPSPLLSSSTSTSTSSSLRQAGTAMSQSRLTAAALAEHHAASSVDGAEEQGGGASSAAEAFERWRGVHARGTNMETEAELAACRDAARAAKRRQRDVAQDVHNAKRAMDALIVRIDTARADCSVAAHSEGGKGDPDDDGDADPREAVLVGRLREVKAEYRAAFHELARCKAEAQHAEARRKVLYRELVIRFSDSTGLTASAVASSASPRHTNPCRAPTDATSEHSTNVARVRPH